MVKWKWPYIIQYKKPSTLKKLFFILNKKGKRCLHIIVDFLINDYKHKKMLVHFQTIFINLLLTSCLLLLVISCILCDYRFVVLEHGVPNLIHKVLWWMYKYFILSGGNLNSIHIILLIHIMYLLYYKL